MVRPVAIVVACLAACNFTPGKLTGDGPVRDDAAIDTLPDAGQCAAASVECIDNTLRECTAPGETAVDTRCAWGCVPSGPAHCGVFQPAANAVMVSDIVPDATLAEVTLGNGIVIDTMLGQIGTLQTSDSVRGSGPGKINGIVFEDRDNVGVFRVKSLRITASMQFPVSFVGPNAVAIVADGEIVIEGYFDARGPCSGAAGPHFPGPGGFLGGTAKGNGAGTGGGTGAPVNSDGAGGGGHAGHGGDGTSDLANDPGQPGGSAYGDAVISVLVGGSGGGGGSAGGAARGGGGGGGIQLVSNTGIRIVTGGINAGGCGGESMGGGSDGGGGGGAGGTILLEAPAISVAAGAAITANGGGGGCGKGTGLAEAGRWDTTAAAGKSGCVGGTGGAGGAAALLDGRNAVTVASEPGGGGGGAVGRIRLNTPGDNGLTVDGAALLSPTIATTACTRGAATVQ